MFFDKVMHMSKNSIYLIISIFIAALLIFYICYYSMNHNFDETYKHNLQIQANLIDSNIRNEKYRLYLEISGIVDSEIARRCFEEKTEKSYDEFIYYIIQRYNVNIITLVDADGMVLDNAKTLPKGYHVSVPLMKNALDGIISADIVRFKKNGISICAAAPIYLKGVIVGALMIGDAMRTNAFVDNIKEVTNIDMTVFEDDTRVSTTIIKDGQRIVGTKLENYEYILDRINKDGAFNENVNILGVPYKAIYWPIRNNEGDFLGIWFLGNNEKEARASIIYHSLLCFIATLIISCIICFISIYFVNGMVNPLKKQSITDELTGVFNRYGIEKLFSAIHRDAEPAGSFILIDLDNFKDVNDTLGHPTGDYVLKRTARVLKDFFRNADIVCRLGGDEFLVYAPDLHDETIIKKKIRQLSTMLKYGYNLGGNDTLFVTASIGIALCPQNGRSYKTLYDNADAALYHIKETGRNGFGFYGQGRCA